MLDTGMKFYILSPLCSDFEVKVMNQIRQMIKMTFFSPSKSVVRSFQAVSRIKTFGKGGRHCLKIPTSSKIEFSIFLVKFKFREKNCHFLFCFS